MSRPISTLVALICLSGVGLAVSPVANAAKGWLPTTAAAKIKTTYVTTDPVRLAAAQHDVDQLTAAGIPSSDPRMIRALQAVTDAKQGARPDKVTCQGVGKKARRYMKFRCTAHLTGIAEYASDYSATVKLTVRLPYRVLAGWR